MITSWSAIAAAAIGTLSDEERSSSAVYLDEEIVPAGTVLRIDGQEVKVPWPAAVAFVDLRPAANWAHPCRYLLIDREGTQIESIEARWPPFLRGPAPSLRLIWKGADVPAWTLAVPEEGEL
jgi:hypothetical protein